ncbi:MAG: hypothetical protein HGA31_05100 [Candidatus Moranbacteria bacterium]|nr:hypothetical protein [Candidatus Moranbacteria bacterium]
MPDLPSIKTLFSLSKETVGLLSFFAIFVGTGAGVGFLFGRGKLGNIFLDIYISLAVSGALLGVLPFDNIPTGGAILFCILLAFLIAIDQHLFELHISSSAYDIFWRVFVMGLLVTGMAVSALVSLLPAKTVASFTLAPLHVYFGTPLASALWLSLPLLVLIFMNKRLK